MSSTTTRNKIGQEDIKWWDGVSDTFTRETSTGGLLTLNKIGSDVFVAEAYGSGTVSGTALSTAIASIGTSSVRSLVLRPGTWSLTNDLTIPSNIILKPLPGAILNVATGKTLTINGPIEAGPVQIFSWDGTGAFDISGSPTPEIYLEWWGAVTGTGNDCTDAINMCFDSRGSHQVITLLKGLYRITTGITYGGAANSQMAIVGQGMDSSRFYIDIGGAGTGFIFGTPGVWYDSRLRLENVGFVGPASCCEYGVQIYLMMIQARNTNFFMGASEYALATYAGEHCSMIETYFRSPGGGYVGPAGAMLMDTDAGSGWSNTVWKLDIHAHGNGTPTNVFTNPALKINSWGVGELTGVIEAYTKPIEFEGISPMSIHDLYIEGAGTTATLTNCTNISMKDVLFADGGLEVILDGCSNIDISNSFLVNTTIKSNCKAITLGNNQTYYSTKIYDYAGAVNATGWQTGAIAAGADKSNILYNTSLSRWTASAPDYYGITGTGTKCGTGLADTTAHNTPYCTKITTTAAYGAISQTLDSVQFKRVLGKFATWSIYSYVPTGETFTQTIPYFGITLASWADATVYDIGEGISDSNGYTWVAVQAGTSGGVEPSWPANPTSADLITDNTIIWGYKDDLNIGSRYIASNIGLWRPVGYTRYVPPNATGAEVGCLVYRDTTDCVAYFSEPSLMVSQTATSSYVPGEGEAQSFMQIGANKISYGTAVPASGWCQQGDIVWRTDATTAESPGWICTTSGVGGVDAVWKTFGVVS